jgi:uncharacterized protein DUF5947
MRLDANLSSPRGLASLRSLVRHPPEQEKCDLCSAALGEPHQHLADPRLRRLLCTCDACAILFSGDGETRYRRVPRDGWYLSDFRLSEEVWSSLAIPIGLVFIYISSVADQILAIHPSPAGIIESALDKKAWETLIMDNPVLRTLSPDVEALLINRMNGAREYFWVPIDQCYRLTGVVRKHWRGFSGGNEAWLQIGEVLDRLKEHSSDRGGRGLSHEF